MDETSSDKEKTIKEFLDKYENDRRKDNLRRNLFDYLIEKIRKKQIKNIPRNFLFRIEERVEELVNEIVDDSLNELKKQQINEVISHNTNPHFDRYEMQKESDEVEVIDKDKFPEHAHFSRYDS